MQDLLYFAYGSNMDLDRINDRLDYLGKLTEPVPYKLHGYTLCFNAESVCPNCNFANIQEANSEQYVEGLLYQLNHDQFKRLDSIETLYERQYFNIDQQIATTYICTDKFYLGNRFSMEYDYFNLLYKAAINNVFNTTLEKLEQYILSHNIKPLKFRNKRDKFLKY